jgi:hypothetical protein
VSFRGPGEGAALTLRNGAAYIGGVGRLSGIFGAAMKAPPARPQPPSARPK